MHRIGALSMAALLALAVPGPAHADLRGHGGPVRALAVAPDGRVAISGGFDQSAILWSLERETAIEVLRFHDGAVNAVAALPDGRFVTGGEDGRVAIWQRGKTAPVQVIAGHAGPVAGLALAPDGRSIASASWDRTVRVTPLAGGAPRVLEGHDGNVNGVAFLPDGSSVVSAGYDATLRIWPLDAAGPPLVRRTATPLLAVAVAPDGEIAAAGADGLIHRFGPDGAPRGEIASNVMPVTAIAITRDGRTIAAGGIAGRIAVIERASATVLREIASPGGPVWSLAFTPDGHSLLSGSADRLVRQWDPDSGAPIGRVAPAAASEPGEAGADARGAQVFGACTACHTLSPDGGNRAGPTLHGVFGRRIATAPGYNYSEALRRMDIVWTPATISRLFEIGPDRYTPGTKMPDQTIGDPEDRAALIRFLEHATAPK
jgi:cytochrome c